MGSCTSSKNSDCFCTNSNVYEIGANREHIRVLLRRQSNPQSASASTRRPGLQRCAHPLQAEGIVCDILRVCQEVLCWVGCELCKLKSPLRGAYGHLHRGHFHLIPL